MRMKTFKAASATAAFAQVKAELGSDAVILSNNTITENGCKCCEIVAAIDNSPVNIKRNTKENVIEDALQNSVGWQREWSQIKGHIMALMKPQIDLDSLTPKQKIALEYLEREEVDENVLTKIYCELRNDKDCSIITALDSLISVTPFNRTNWAGKFHAFTGPGGAGKTSSLVRLALKEKKANPKARICLATADGSRGKGRLVLKHYAELADLTFKEIATKDDFADLENESSKFDIIFIDLPGLPGQTKLADWLLLYGMDKCTDLSVHLVLNPYYSTAQFERFVAKYKSEQLASVIWTKLDEACTFGAILNMAFASGLPVSALSYGSGLKNSIAPATKEMIWRLLFMRKLPDGDIQP